MIRIHGESIQTEGNCKMWIISDEQTENLLRLMVNIGKRKIQLADAEDVASESLIKAMQSYDPSRGATFEQFLMGVVHPRRLNDTLAFIYRRKDHKSINFIYHEENTIDIIDEKSDKVNKVLVHAKELLDCGQLNTNEYNIVVMKANRFSNKEIAKELELTEGRISQIWNEIKPVLVGE